jgi:hypothetical protein
VTATVSTVGSATFNEGALTAYRPKRPAGRPWADYWYCYINDPGLGYFKIAFLSYLGKRTGEQQSAYLHIAFFPHGGGFREYDFHADRVSLDTGSDDHPYSFRFEVPGRAIITEGRIELTLPEASIVANLQGAHDHYWNGCNPANGPFTPESDIAPADASHWFIFTMGTPADYGFRDEQNEHRGNGIAYIERGWSSAAAPGFTYLVATGDKVRLMLVEGGKSAGRGGDTWAGRIDICGHSLRLLPQPGDHRAISEIDATSGTVSLVVEQGAYRLELRSVAALTDFYDQITPSQTVFEGQYPVMKTMNAALDIALFKDGNEVERAALPQSILEFGGASYRFVGQERGG